jgi:hypothetical protein
MSQSTHVIGFRPPDDKWKAMKTVYDACDQANVRIPEEVAKFFNGSRPDPSGVEVRIDNTPAVKEYRADMVDGYEIDITKLPPGLTIIRVYNSY